MPTRYRLIVPFIVLVGVGLWLWTLTHDPRIVDMEVGGETFAVEVVSSAGDRSRGLSGRDALATSTGMLFVFPRLDIYPFWMKDMRFPIDIIWIDGDWCVVNIAHRAAPETYPDSFVPTREALYVLEVQAGIAAQKGIDTTTCFRPPLI